MLIVGSRRALPQRGAIAIVASVVVNRSRSSGLSCFRPCQVADSLSSAVLTAAKEMEDKPAGRVDFFDTLQEKINACGPQGAGQFTLKMGTSAYQAAVRR